jgi:hypothetical protein
MRSVKSLTFWRTVVAVVAFALVAYTVLAPSEAAAEPARLALRTHTKRGRAESREEQGRAERRSTRAVHEHQDSALYGPRAPFSQVGILSTPTGPIALFARPTRRAADRWNYFAVSNQTVPQKLPVFRDGRDCGKLLGCPEVSDGDALDVRGSGQATVTLYARD